MRANRPRWIWPAVVVLALLALFWGARGRARHVPTYDTAAGNVAAPVAPTYDTSTMPNTTAMAPATGQIRLPDGTTLNAAPNGVESQLATFIANPGQQPSSASSFDFDHVSFADNSAQLQPQSQDQLNNVAKILTAYPNVNVKIAGYMGAGGNASANKQLATQRASAVRQALIKDGVPANRITSEGQAAQHPIANNATVPGSAQNQRVAIIVTKK